MTRILVVDDEDQMRNSIARLLERSGYACTTASDVGEARLRLDEQEFSLALLDVRMPGGSGMDLLAYVRAERPSTAAVMVTGEDDPALATSALEMGAYGYIIKPFKTNEVLINVANALMRRGLEIENREYRERLERLLGARSEELWATISRLEQAEEELGESHRDAIQHLARAAEFRDEETARHIERVSYSVGLLAEQMGFDEEDVQLVRLASSMHDIGKVAIPDGILFKPAKLRPDEVEVIRRHAEIGYGILAEGKSKVVALGAIIAWTHHEWWDGTGYPRGLSGDDIPIEGRMTAVADVFDALTSRRVYRPEFPPQKAVGLMLSERGSHFDPELLDVFLERLDEVLEFRNLHPD